MTQLAIVTKSPLFALRTRLRYFESQSTQLRLFSRGAYQASRQKVQLKVPRSSGLAKTAVTRFVPRAFDANESISAAHLVQAPRFLPSYLDRRRDSSQKFVVLDPTNVPYRPPTADIKATAIMHSYLQVVATPTADTPGTFLVLHFDERRYLFGQLGEGAQRSCTEQGVRLSKVTDCFLTGKTEWNNTGGLLGLILTLADVQGKAVEARDEELNKKLETKKALLERRTGQAATEEQFDIVENKTPTLTLHGGANLTHTLATGRRFVFRKGMPVYTNEWPEKKPEESITTPNYADELISVWTLPISPSGAKSATSTSSSPSSTMSGRKRSLDEFEEREPASESLDKTNTAYRDQQLRDAVVAEMFNSNWSLDALHETKLADVNMPCAIFIRDTVNHKLEPYTGPKPGEGKPLPDIKVLVRKPWPGALVSELPPTKPSPVSMSYICRGHPQRGTFDPKKAAALNIQPGPLFADLTKGKSVQSRDGKTITPDMVLGDPKHGRGFAMIDLPGEEYVDDLISRPEWKCEEIMKGVEVFIWALGPGVHQSPKLLDFIASMDKAEHIVSSPDTCGNRATYDTATVSSMRLNNLCGNVFPKHVFDRKKTFEGRALAVPSKSGPSFTTAERGLKVQLTPKHAMIRDEIAPPLEAGGSFFEVPKSVKSLADAADLAISQPNTQNKLKELIDKLPSPEAEVITLGTGSSMPSKARNVSATLLRVPGQGSYLLDCGEGTLGQLRRLFGPEKLKEVFKDLKMIWISHLHADHHLGTASVIRAWYDSVHGGNAAPRTEPSDRAEVISALNEKDNLVVVSETDMIKWLEEYSTVEPLGFNKVIPLSIHTIKPAANYLRKDALLSDYSRAELAVEFRWNKHSMNFRNPISELTTALKAATGLTDMESVRVNHCHGARAVTLRFPDTFSLSYSGDCRPCLPFAVIGQDSTVLLHEATFDDDMRGDAIAKKHSTTSEALKIAALMRAKTVVLTHFSQRYQRIPIMSDNRDLLGTDKKVRASPRLTAVPDIKGVPIEDDSMDIEEGQIEPEATVRLVASPSPPSSENFSTSDLKVAVAFDLMQIKVKDIPKMEFYTPALTKLFEVEMREAAARSDAIAARERGEAGTAAKKGKNGPGQQKQQMKLNKAKQAKQKQERSRKNSQESSRKPSQESLRKSPQGSSRKNSQERSRKNSQ